MWNSVLSFAILLGGVALAQNGGQVSMSACPATYFQLSDPPYENYFVSTCNFAATVVASSPLENSNLTLISPRLIAAFPAGNSGAVAYFAPKNGINGTLSLTVVNNTGSNAIAGLPSNPTDATNGTFGVTGIVEFNDSAILTVPILGSIRSVRDFVEGPSLLRPIIQDAIEFQNVSNGVNLHRLWLDNVTTMDFGFSPVSNGSISLNNRTVTFTAGQYHFNVSFNYTQLVQLNQSSILNTQSEGNATSNSTSQNVQDLSFLTYSNKMLAGTWRFLTYFGRDTMIAMLLMKDRLSNEALEAGIGAVLERENATGVICHEETIGDYATLTNLLNNITSTAPSYSYIMIDSDLYLQPLLVEYFLNTPGALNRTIPFLSSIASVNPANAGVSYAELAFRNAFHVMSIAAPFAAEGNQTEDNLIHLREGQIVGQWRDSTYGIGGAMIPYDVNTALVPASLRAIAQLTDAGFYPSYSNWSALANQYAQVWEDETLHFFEVTVPQAEAQQRVETYVQESNFTGPAGNVTEDILFYGLGLNGYNNQSTVLVMNSDDCFRHFLLTNTTNQTQLTTFVNQTANHLNARFPVGLMTDVSMLVANPAYGTIPNYAANWTTGAYHGTVVWGWPLAMMAAGLEKQLLRCNGTANIPSFCNDTSVYHNVISAYNNLWNSIEDNTDQLRTEVWSWVYNNGFQVTPLGDLPAPGGAAQTESDIVQLWSLTVNFAVLRNPALAG